jgi:hypothetical protein
MADGTVRSLTTSLWLSYAEDVSRRSLRLFRPSPHAADVLAVEVAAVAGFGGGLNEVAPEPNTARRRGTSPKCRNKPSAFLQSMREQRVSEPPRKTASMNQDDSDRQTGSCIGRYDGVQVLAHGDLLKTSASSAFWHSHFTPSKARDSVSATPATTGSWRTALRAARISS